jgi:hypothetical protein
MTSDGIESYKARKLIDKLIEAMADALQNKELQKNKMLLKPPA